MLLLYQYETGAETSVKAFDANGALPYLHHCSRTVHFVKARREICYFMRQHSCCLRWTGYREQTGTLL
ncbi:MAG: hypothetical protein K1W41_07425 [Lachnospiraceae bacterium]